MSLNEIGKAYQAGMLTVTEAVNELLNADPVRFQRQRHLAYSFLTLNHF
jgi:hypothetical protein